MKKALYFRTEEGEWCQTLDAHIEDAESEGLETIELFEAVPEKVAGFFWCRAVGEVSEEGTCGKLCDDYEPKNGKSGMCRHKYNTLYTTGAKVTFEVSAEHPFWCLDEGDGKPRCAVQCPFCEKGL